MGYAVANPTYESAIALSISADGNGLNANVGEFFQFLVKLRKLYKKPTRNVVEAIDSLVRGRWR